MRGRALEPMTLSQSQRLPNGFTTVVLPHPGAHQVLVSLLVKVGSRLESPVENGISHFLEHLLFRGNAAFPSTDAMNLAFERAGSILNAQTGVEHTEFYFVAAQEGLAEGLRALAHFVAQPTFDEVEKERRIILDEIQYDYNDKGNLTNLATLTSLGLWPGQALGQPVIGTPQTVEVLTRDLLRQHHAQHYRPHQMVLALAGDLRPEEAFRQAEQAFGTWTGEGAGEAHDGAGPSLGTALSVAPPVASMDPRRVADLVHKGPLSTHEGPWLQTVEDTDNQFHLQLSFPAPGYNDPRETQMVLLSRLLDDGPLSRLQREVREERALVYHIAADHTGYWDIGQFDITTSVHADRIEEVLRVIFGTLRDFREQGPGAEELEQAKLRHRHELAFSRDSLAAAIDRYAWPLLYSTVVDEEEELAQVQALDAHAMREIATELFQPKRLHLVVVGPTQEDTT